MYAKDNARRVNEFQLDKPALAKAGFDLIDNGSAEWSAKLGDGTLRRRVLRLAVDHARLSAPTRRSTRTGAVNNLVGYSQQEGRRSCSTSWSSPGRGEQVKLQTQIEKQLFEDAIGIPIFQFPAANISNKTRVTDVNPAILAPTMFYGFWDWKVPSAN